MFRKHAIHCIQNSRLALFRRRAPKSERVNASLPRVSKPIPFNFLKILQVQNTRMREKLLFQSLEYGKRQDVRHARRPFLKILRNTQIVWYNSGHMFAHLARLMSRGQVTVVWELANNRIAFFEFQIQSSNPLSDSIKSSDFCWSQNFGFNIESFSVSSFHWNDFSETISFKRLLTHGLKQGGKKLKAFKLKASMLEEVIYDVRYWQSLINLVVYDKPWTSTWSRSCSFILSVKCLIRMSNQSV